MWSLYAYTCIVFLLDSTLYVCLADKQTSPQTYVTILTFSTPAILCRIFNDRVSEAGNAIGFVRLSVRLFVSILTF